MLGDLYSQRYCWFLRVTSSKMSRLCAESFLPFSVFHSFPPLRSLSSSVTLFSAHLALSPPSPHRFKHTHTITQLSLSLSLVSAAEVRVWVFYPRATQPCFTTTVTPALSATLDPALLGSSGRRLAMTTAPGHTLRHMLHVQSCAVGPVMVAIPLSGPVSQITKRAGMQREAELWCGCEVN